MNDITDLMRHVTRRIRQEDVDGTIFTPFYRVPTMTRSLQYRSSFCLDPTGSGYKRKCQIYNRHTYKFTYITLPQTTYNRPFSWELIKLRCLSPEPTSNSPWTMRPDVGTGGSFTLICWLEHTTWNLGGGWAGVCMVVKWGTIWSRGLNGGTVGCVPLSPT